MARAAPARVATGRTSRIDRSDASAVTHDGTARCGWNGGSAESSWHSQRDSRTAATPAGVAGSPSSENRSPLSRAGR